MRLEYKWQAALIVALGMFMAVLDNTIVNVALIPMERAFHTDNNTIIWVITAYFLAQSAVIPVTGFLSDLIGAKRVFLAALALFTLGSALCAFAPSEGALIVFRVVQGIGGGALFPTAFAIVYRIFPPAERGPASAVIGVPVLLAPAFGPTIGGFLTTTFEWRAIFTVNIPVGIVALLLVALVLRPTQNGEREGTARHRFDVAGLLLSTVGVTALVYGISEAGRYGWGDTNVVRFLIAGGLLLLAFIVVELRVSDPVMDVRLFANYTFAVANVLLWAVSALLFGSIVLLPIFLESLQGRTPLDTGVVLISQGVAAAVSTVIAGRFYNRLGPRALAAVGFALIAVGTWGFTNLALDTTAESLQVWLILRGLGLGLTNIPLQTLALSVVNNRQMARASSLVSVTRQVFGAIGVSAVTTYFTQQTVTHGAQLAAQLRQVPPVGVAASCLAQAPRGLDAVRGCVVAHAAVLGLNDAFFIAAVGCALAAVLAIFLGHDPAVRAARQAQAGRAGEPGQPAQPAFVGE